ncbi:helix-turn-helix domain-containing protein [Flavobacterium sp.]|uniref:helix-turn-helix domain-containing protein n=1 Tax=Flavobacterium sp. TaxID=239 RepID=UPI003751078A
MTSTNKSIGKRIREIRKDKNISIEKMAEMLKVSYSTYQRIENGETNSWALHLEEISTVLEVSIEDILLGKDKNIQIVKEQSTGYLNSDVVINNLSEKIIELYESRLKDKDAMIEQLQKMLNKG